MLTALAATVFVALAAAFCGVSPPRSLWSDYERMQGVVELAHWAAFAVVLCALLRTERAWRAFVAAEVGVAAAVAALVLILRLDAEVPFLAAADPDARSGEPLGNANYLGHYMLVNGVLALGLLARALTRSGATGGWTARAACLAWAGAAGLHAAALSLSGSLGALAGAGAGALFLAAFLARFAATRRARRAALAALIIGLALAAVAGGRFLAPERPAPGAAGNPLIDRALAAHHTIPTVQSRLAAWRAGAEAFAERPLLGWGPGNFEAAFGRFASGYGAHIEPHDTAHSGLVETAATTGIAGLLAYLALWALALAACTRAAAGARGRARCLPLAAATALTAAFVHAQFHFETATTSLLAAILIAWAAHLERPRPSARPDPSSPTRRLAWTALALAALALAAADLAAHRAIRSAAEADLVLKGPRTLAYAIERFEPLANTHRTVLLNGLARLWPDLYRRDPDAARELLEPARRAATAAERAEPHNWRIAHTVARFWAVVADSEARFSPDARRAAARARVLAPNRPLYPRTPAPPEPLRIETRADGGAILTWRPAPGAGFHQLAVRGADGRFRTLAHVYDPDTASRAIAPRLAARTPPASFRVRACRRPHACSPWQHWPPRGAGTPPGR